MNASVMTTMSKASVISRFYNIFKFLWMCLFILFIIGGICNICQLLLLHNLPFDALSVLTILLIVSLFLSGICGLYCNCKIEKRNYRTLQTLCIISACLTIPFLFIIYIGVISATKSLFLKNNIGLYYFLYILLFVLEICGIILNYQMNKFYKNFNETIIKECLLLSNINFN